MTLREQADRHRAARGLTVDQRHYVACVLFNWWRLRAPTAGIGCYVGHDKLRATGDQIEEGAAKYPEVIQAAGRAVRARIERFEAARATPRLMLTASGPVFAVREYDNWSRFKGEKLIHGAKEYRYDCRGVDLVADLDQRHRWTDQDAKLATMYATGKYRADRPIPQSVREGARDYNRIVKRSTLVPTPAERQRYRKACGLIRPRKVKTA